MSEAQHKAQGIVGISLMVQIGETLTNELRMITSSFSKVMFKGKPWEISKENFSKKKSKIQKNSKSFQKFKFSKLFKKCPHLKKRPRHVVLDTSIFECKFVEKRIKPASFSTL